MDEGVRSALLKRQAELLKIVESFEKLAVSIEWATLKELVFDKTLASIEKQLFSAVTSRELDTAKIYKLQGEYEWAKKYANITSFIETSVKELENINQRLK